MIFVVLDWCFIFIPLTSAKQRLLQSSSKYSLHTPGNHGLITRLSTLVEKRGSL